MGSNKPAILQARPIELSAQGISDRKIACGLTINRRSIARILAGPEARRMVLDRGYCCFARRGDIRDAVRNHRQAPLPS
jgi:hypothetical protein